MKTKVFLFVILVLAVPVFAEDVSFTTTGGTFSGTSSGYVLTGATLTQVAGPGGTTYSGSNLGMLSFSTGILGSTSNVIVGGPILPGGTLTITSNGSDGLSAGTLFSGTFSQGGTWGYVVQSDGTYLYTLNADVTGQYGSSDSAKGPMIFTIDTGNSIFPGYTSASGRDTLSVVRVAEPAELGFIGIGLLGLAGTSRLRKN